jgi:hypothetical protein
MSFTILDLIPQYPDNSHEAKIQEKETSEELKLLGEKSRATEQHLSFTPHSWLRVGTIRAADGALVLADLPFSSYLLLCPTYERGSL